MEKLCVVCTAVIQPERAAHEDIVNCVRCKKYLDKSSPDSFEHGVDEGIAGTLEVNKRTRGNNFGDLQRRNRE